MTKVAVTSKSFSKNPFLKEELLKKYPQTKFNETGLSFNDQTLVDFLQGAEKVIVGLEKINSEVLSKIPTLKLVSKYGVGLDNIDLDLFLKNNIELAWTGGVNRRGVAELALGFMINLIRGVHLSNKRLQKGTWAQHIGLGLRELRVGIVGLGHVGKELAKILRFLDVEVFAYDILDQSTFAQEHNVKLMSFSEILSQSNLITLHIPHDEKTHFLFNEEAFKRMQKGAFLVNTARGGIVDEAALYEYLTNGHLAGAAFDVFEEEPFNNQKLIELENFVSTPHIAGSANESVLAMGMAAIQGLDRGKKALRENFFNY